MELPRERVSDPRMLDLIVRFLKCGVMLEGQREATDDGVPRPTKRVCPACLSPLLAGTDAKRWSMYLHDVLDQWFENDVKPRLQGEAYLIRYADDFICAFECESDARAFQSVLPKRLSRFSLEVAEEKTKLLRFGRFAERDSTHCGEGAPGTFDFLGFTHYCGHARSGRFKLKRRTSTKKLRAKLLDLKTWFHSMLTTPIEEVWSTLNAKLCGHYQYYGINDSWEPDALTAPVNMPGRF
ncbi:MAG: reverse transcriptase domain-containing protein [Planctomycetota bacterium]|nr:reverse transcriptase domain-containing protein [Planctomycetota bacterium]